MITLQIEKPHIESLVHAFPRLAMLKEQLRFGNKVEVPFGRLSEEELAYLNDLYLEEENESAARLSTLLKALGGEGKRFGADDLESVLPALVRHLASDAIRGWLFCATLSGKNLPYVVTRLDYVPASQEESRKVLVELKANAKGTIPHALIRITSSDIAGRRVGEMLAEKGYLKETQELIAAYDETEARYFDWRARYGAQFSGRGTGFYAEDPSATHRNTDWSRKDVVVLSAGGGAARLVNDEGILSSRTLTLESPGDILGPYLRKAHKSDRYTEEDETELSRSEIPEGLFTRIPVHPYLFMFHLELHHYLWVHADDLLPYEYRPALREKLVLPPEHTDLIDILTAEMDMLMDDIVEGKSGGTTVLCAGPPGVGKTLTAEVYSEIIKRPLYRVHSGQLGLNVAAMETALKEVLTRAQRWGAVMLIDEADVYIKRRDYDIAMNAVVGVFLRVLEYFNGLLFLTTNRVEDIDEAIVSRCIAMIRFSPPQNEARRRIWEVMMEQFGLEMPPLLLNELVEMFPAATGRDIKGLAKLVAKYCSQKNVLPTPEVFRRCSVFRGMEAFF